MLQRKVPIHGIGSESHLDGNSNAKSADAAQFYQAVHALGLSVALSELDINDSWENGDAPTRKAKNGRVYADFITWIASAVPLSRISFWTVSDTRNWLDGAAQRSASFRRKDGEAHAPGLLVLIVGTCQNGVDWHGRDSSGHGTNSCQAREVSQVLLRRVTN